MQCLPLFNILCPQLLNLSSPSFNLISPLLENFQIPVVYRIEPESVRKEAHTLRDEGGKCKEGERLHEHRTGTQIMQAAGHLEGSLKK